VEQNGSHGVHLPAHRGPDRRAIDDWNSAVSLINTSVSEPGVAHDHDGVVAAIVPKLRHCLAVASQVTGRIDIIRQDADSVEHGVPRGIRVVRVCWVSQDVHEDTADEVGVARVEVLVVDRPADRSDGKTGERYGIGEAVIELGGLLRVEPGPDGWVRALDEFATRDEGSGGSFSEKQGRGEELPVAQHGAQKRIYIK
jgi:hypothetical protein